MIDRPEQHGGFYTDLYADVFGQPHDPGAGNPPADARPAIVPGQGTPVETQEADAEITASRMNPTAQLTGVIQSPQKLTPANSPALQIPKSMAQSGLTLMHICDIILKQLYLQRSQLGIEIARSAHLPFNILDDGLAFLIKEKCIEVASGELIGRASYQFNLTELGRTRAKEAFERCRYMGPAPVPLEDYIKQCRLQTVTGTPCRAEPLIQAFQDFIIRPGLLDELGPAVCSGKSIFVYGPPGNGKTMIAKGLGQFLNQNGGEIFVPYAIHTAGSIITIFDPTLHQTTDDELLARRLSGDPQAETAYPADLRWRRVRRPVVITGGELTLDMLDLRYNRASNYYTAPLHIKANSGVFLIDDFGRQIVSPRDLLNRWILPLEEHIDFLTLATGKKFAVPFEQLIIFSTNLEPSELVDEAFLRRIRHKIKIDSPPADLYIKIFQLNCRLRNIPFNPSAVDYLYVNYYNRGKLPRSSDPRDLLEIMQSICRFKNQPAVLTPENIAEAAERFFCQV